MSRFVPYLAEEAIERDAAALLAEYEHARGVTIEPPIPVEDIVEKHLKLRIEFDDMHARHNMPRPAERPARHPRRDLRRRQHLHRRKPRSRGEPGAGGTLSLHPGA